MTSTDAFSATPHLNPFLAAGEDLVCVVLTVTASGALQRTADRAEVIIVDNSGSMSAGNKLNAVKKAAMAAVDRLEDGVEFAVVTGNDVAKRIWPPLGSQGRPLAVAGPVELQRAQNAIRRIQVRGATRIGNWLDFARELFTETAAELRHVTLLSDGQNTAPRGHLEAAIERCAGTFQCDCLGFGTDWDVDELTGIARALGGLVDMIAHVSDTAGEQELVELFRRLVAASQARVLPAVRLRVITAGLSDVAAVEQSTPEYVSLTEAASPAPDGPAALDYPLGGWAPVETRDYFVAVKVRASHVGGVGERRRVAYLDLVLADGSSASQATSIEVTWTDDDAQSTRVEPTVARHISQREKADHIRAGLAALKSDDAAAATAHFVEARQAAVDAGDKVTLAWLDRMLEVDPETGTVVLRRLEKADEMRFQTESTKTVRLDPPPPPAPDSDSG